jgi:gluconokinase
MDIIVMGVSGCGKSTIAKALSDHLQVEYLEGDDYHPNENIAKMSLGKPLTDEDRVPWLNQLSNLIKRKQALNQPFVMTCSALKRSYREQLAANSNEIVFVYLKGTEPAINMRLQKRQNHFMSTTLISSQFAALQEPQADEVVITLSIGKSVAEILEEALTEITKLSNLRLIRSHITISP